MTEKGPKLGSGVKFIVTVVYRNECSSSGNGEDRCRGPTSSQIFPVEPTLFREMDHTTEVDF